MGFLGLFKGPEAEELYDGYEAYDEYDDYQEPYQEYDEPEPEPTRPVDFPGVQPIRSVADMQIVLTQPTEYSAASEIADMLRDMKFVVLNLAKTEPEVARRLLDFVSGVVYSEDAHIMKVATNVYVVAPYFVDLLEDEENSAFYRDAASL